MNIKSKGLMWTLWCVATSQNCPKLSLLVGWLGHWHACYCGNYWHVATNHKVFGHFLPMTATYFLALDIHYTPPKISMLKLAIILYINALVMKDVSCYFSCHHYFGKAWSLLGKHHRVHYSSSDTVTRRSTERSRAYTNCNSRNW